MEALVALGKGKAWWKSKQLWIFGIALTAGALQRKFGWIMDAEMQVTALAIIGIVLRVVTNEPISWSDTSNDDEEDDE